jgi:hypothetical protein
MSIITIQVDQPQLEPEPESESELVELDVDELLKIFDDEELVKFPSELFDEEENVLFIIIKINILNFYYNSHYFFIYQMSINT